MPKRKASIPLTQEQLADLGEKSLQSAMVLISDADDLLRLGSCPHAYATAILAGEEFGKSQLAVGAIARTTTDEAYWKGFWSTFYSHGPKLARGALIAGRWLDPHLLEPFVAILELALRGNRRESGLYVDVVDGVVVAPGELINCQEASEVVEVFGQVIVGYASIFEGRGLRAAYLEVADAASEMRAALESRDIEQVKATWALTTGRELGDDEVEEITTGWAVEDA